MASQNSIPAGAVLVAIDIAKVRDEVLIETPGFKRRRLSVFNTRAEHDHLIVVLQAYGQPVVCAFESTMLRRPRQVWNGRLATDVRFFHFATVF